jgi:cytochrome c oxidase subunit III
VGRGRIDPQNVQLFFFLYFGMTGLHAVHMVIGIGVLSWLIVPAAKGRFTGDNHNWVEGAGLYWHFVDIVWIFLFPLLYLVERHI